MNNLWLSLIVVVYLSIAFGFGIGCAEDEVGGVASFGMALIWPAVLLIFLGYLLARWEI